MSDTEVRFSLPDNLPEEVLNYGTTSFAYMATMKAIKKLSDRDDPSHWSKQTCEGCEYQINDRCKYGPPPRHHDVVKSRKGLTRIASDYPIVRTLVDDKAGAYNKACAQYSLLITSKHEVTNG